MPLFLTDAEFRLCSDDPIKVASKADEFIVSLRRQLDTARAEAEAAEVKSEQTHNVLEQRYLDITEEIFRVQAESEEFAADAETKSKELAEVLKAKRELEHVLVSKDGEIERLMVEVSEMHRSKRQFLDLMEHKDKEIGEKNATIQSNLDKIVRLTEDAIKMKGSLHASEAEITRCKTTCSRFSQEKDLIEKHNKWLNDELNDKLNRLTELRKSHIDFEEDMKSKLYDIERKFNESSKSAKRSEERVREYLGKITTLEKELLSSKDSATINEERYMSELSTATKLVELYKETSEECSKKGGELEGVIKALETHLLQIENEYKDKLQNELSAKDEFEKHIKDLQEKLQKYETKVVKSKQSTERRLLQISNLRSEANMDDIWIDETESDLQNDSMSVIVPRMPFGISETALAASLLRDGWTHAKTYEKYHEVSDAFRHERWGRKHAEAILERVLHEIENKAETILEERAEHKKMLDAYSSLNQRLQGSLLENDGYEITISTLKAELKKRDYDYTIAQKEIDNLEKQITVLLKEFQDVQIRYGVNSQVLPNQMATNDSSMPNDDGCHTNEFSYKDINELVQKNRQLRYMVNSLSSIENVQIAEPMENFQMEFKKKKNEAEVEAVLKRCEEQACMIDSLYGSVAMYKRLFEEKSKFQASSSNPMGSIPGEGKINQFLLVDGYQDSANMTNDVLAERIKCLEDDLAKSTHELLESRFECDKITKEAKLSSEKIDSLMKDLDYQLEDANSIRVRNVKLNQLLVDYQRKLKESTDFLNASEDLSKKLSVEVSILKSEKEILQGAEKKASEQINSLSEKVQHLQSSLDTMRCVGEVHEESRLMEKTKLEEYAKRIEKELVDVKKAFQHEHDHLIFLKKTNERLEEESKKQIENMRNELSDSLCALSTAETRAEIAEARFSNLETMVKNSTKSFDGEGLQTESSFTDKEDNGDFCKVRDDMEKLKQDAEDYKNYMIQYKELAQTNELALKQIESTQQKFKAESEQSKIALELELRCLKEKISDLENQCALKSAEALSAVAAKDNAISSTSLEIAYLKEECSLKMFKIGELETQCHSFKEALDAEQERCCSVQKNYERQVILQSETIQELNKTSLAQASLQDELKELSIYSDKLRAENEILKASSQSQMSMLLESKENTERKYKEIDEQNKILHSHLETLHIKLGDRDLSTASWEIFSDSNGDSKLGSVINSLRHAKELTDTEVTILKQEKLRLQSQLDSALKACDRSHALLQSQRENAQTIILTDVEYKSLQLQIEEVNLLRESNTQLREENKHNFEECQKFHEMVQKAKLECAKTATEKNVISDRFLHEINILKEEKSLLEIKVTEFLEKLKNTDTLEFERLKGVIKQKEIKLKEKENEVETTKHLLVEKQESLLNFEQKITKYRNELDEQQKKLNNSLQREMTFQSEIEKCRKINISLKKRLEKEKEDLSKQNYILQKQIEDYKSDAQMKTEDPIKKMEKETRIQMLEKTLEREREDLCKEKEEYKKEKFRRMKTENIVVEHVQKICQEKKKLVEEIRMYKRNVCNVLEGIGITVNQLPPESGLDEQTVAYLFSIGNFEETITTLGDGLDVSSPLADSSSAEAVMEITGQHLSRSPTGVTSLHRKSSEMKVKDIPKLVTDSRRTVRKIVRPHIEQQSEEPSFDSEALDMESSAVIQGKVSEFHEESHSAINLTGTSTSRKRPTTSQHEPESEELPLKKSKASESIKEDADEHDDIPPEAVIPFLTEDVHDIATGQSHDLPDKVTECIRKDEKLDDSNIELQDQVRVHIEELKNIEAPRNEFDVTLETVGETSKGDDDQELLHQHIIPIEDNQEGELVAADQELLLEEGELGHEESIYGDVGGIGGVSPDEVSVDETLIEDLNDKNKVNTITGDGVEISDKTEINPDQTIVEPGDTQLSSSSTVMQLLSNSPIDKTRNAANEPDEKQIGGGRNIVITDRGRQNTSLRQTTTETIARGRGRVSRGSGSRRGAAQQRRGQQIRGRGQGSNDSRKS